MVALTFTAERVRFMFNYDPVTGSLTWRNPLANNIHVGQEAGSVRASNGRRYVVIDGEQHLAHRLIWLYVHGEMPSENITAKNGNYADLRLENLAPQTFAETSSKGVRATNTSGLKGVSWDKSRKKWQATITKNYKQVALGRYDTKEEAAAAYEKACRELVLGIDEGRPGRIARIAKNAVIRRLWRHLVREHDGTIGWSSFEQFQTEMRPLGLTKTDTLAPVRHDVAIGPGNYSVRKAPPRARFDYKTAEGKRAYNREHRAANRDLYKNSDLKKAFGISLEDYRALHDEQNGVCVICKKPETDFRRGKKLPLCVDHCHETGEVRALLCGACNKGIGYLRDNSDLVRVAADSLDFHAARIANKSSSASNVTQDFHEGARDAQ